MKEFLERDQLSGKEGKTLLLNRIIEFQQSTGRKLMVASHEITKIVIWSSFICNFLFQAVYDFLSEYLLQWDGIQYCDQIFKLIADVPPLPYSGTTSSVKCETGWFYIWLLFLFFRSV